MRKKLTITIDEEVYKSLHRFIGKRRISKFIENKIRKEILTENLENGYREMSQDNIRENEAEIFSENLIGDIDLEKR